MSDVGESARAIGAVAEATGKGIDAAQSLGGFLGRIFGAPGEEVGLLVRDYIRARRANNLLAYEAQFEAKRRTLGFEGAPRPIPLKFGLPLLEAVSVEDDATLRDMFAALLANATAEHGDRLRRRVFVDILAGMEALDAEVLLAAYNAPPASMHLYPIRTVYTWGLPEQSEDAEQHAKDRRVKQPRPEVQIALWNLARLGCIEPAGVWDGAATIGIVTVTELGLALIEASTEPHQRTYVAPEVSAMPNVENVEVL